MAETRQRRAKGLVVLATMLGLLPSVGEAAPKSVDCNRVILQSAINTLKPGDTLLVTGTCNENVTIASPYSDLTLDGQGVATINGPDTTAPTVTVLGRGITIRRFTITGGVNGIFVDRGGTARIDDNIVRGATEDGIHVAHNAFARIEGNTIENNGVHGILVKENSNTRILNNTIQNNAGDGIGIWETSSARIGMNSAGDPTPSPNTVQGNGGQGIVVVRNANARIVGNTIQNNAGHGVGVFRGSHAEIANNAIDGNGGNGIEASQGSAVNLGRDSGSGIADLPNRTITNNGRYGINCSLGGYADGRQGSLIGNSGQQNFSEGCIDSLP